jgi:phosphoribosyl-dephospho-CoA transferase
VAFSHVANLRSRVVTLTTKAAVWRDDTGMSLYQETTAAVRALAARARTTENVLFCEQRPLTSLEATFAGSDRLAARLREIEDEAIQALKRLVDAEQGYETALRSIEEAGEDATGWLRAVMLSRSLETLS